jgi:GGDEF domain-containing protein
MRQALSKKGYQVSFGFATHEKTQGEMNIHQLVNEAEINMFAAKRDFYRQPEHNRRNR